jgi:hypothetical protein
VLSLWILKFKEKITLALQPQAAEDLIKNKYGFEASR